MVCLNARGNPDIPVPIMSTAADVRKRYAKLICKCKDSLQFWEIHLPLAENCMVKIKIAAHDAKTQGDDDEHCKKLQEWVKQLEIVHLRLDKCFTGV